MQGQIIKIISDFYYVDTEFGIVECKLRDILKKRDLKVIVGDFVELEALSHDNSQAFISKLLPRKNYISHPKVANVSQAVIVSALKNPDFDFEQLDRYITLCEYHNIKPVLCFNKSDLLEDNSLIDKIKSVYEPLNYDLHFTSVLNNEVSEDFLQILKSKVSLLCGASGVGKSSMINFLSKSLKLRTSNVSEKTKRGVHTTRHCQIFKLENGISIVDTPGFSHVKFDFLLPKDVQSLFPEIVTLNCCKYSDCLHIQENFCNVLQNLDKIASSRYSSYLKFIEEAKDYKQKVIYEGLKTESAVKFNKGKTLTKISERKRVFSRKLQNQNLLIDEDNGHDE